MLLPTKVKVIFQKYSNKQNLVKLFSFSYYKVDFALLTKVIAIYAVFFRIYIWEL